MFSLDSQTGCSFLKQPTQKTSHGISPNSHQHPGKTCPLPLRRHALSGYIRISSHSLPANTCNGLKHRLSHPNEREAQGELVSNRPAS